MANRKPFWVAKIRHSNDEMHILMWTKALTRVSNCKHFRIAAPFECIMMPFSDTFSSIVPNASCNGIAFDVQPFIKFLSFVSSVKYRTESETAFAQFHSKQNSFGFVCVAPICRCAHCNSVAAIHFTIRLSLINSLKFIFSKAIAFSATFVSRSPCTFPYTFKLAILLHTFYTCITIIGVSMLDICLTITRILNGTFILNANHFEKRTIKWYRRNEWKRNGGKWSMKTFHSLELAYLFSKLIIFCEQYANKSIESDVCV